MSRPRGFRVLPRARARSAALAVTLGAGLVLTGCTAPDGVEEPREPPTVTASPAPPSAAPTASGAAAPADPASASASTAELARAELYPCQGYGRVPRHNTVESNARDVYAWHVFEPVAVGDGHGDVDWDADPYEDEGWRLWLASLRWIGPSIEAAREGDEEAFAVAERLIADWAADHEQGWAEDHDNLEANTHRLNVLLCFRSVVLQREGGTVPEEYAWVDELIGRHADQNMARYSARHNHGSMENRGLLGAGCVLDRPKWMRHAMQRVEADLPYQIDEEGLSNEAAPHYAQFNYTLFHAIDTTSTACGVPSEAFEGRVEAMGEALPHMVDSTGSYWQYGDSAEYPVKPFTGISEGLRYAATQGAEGVAPADRVRAFENGPVFGRSSWGTPEEGFRQAASWMLRSGTGTEKKAHRGDLLQFLYTARGRQVIEDGGHPGIVTDNWRPWGLGPTAHNVIHLPTLEEFPGDGAAERTSLTVSPDGSADGASARQALTAGGERSRSVLVLTEPDAAVVVDRTRIEDGRAGHVVESLWNLPTEFTAERIAPDTVRAVESASGEATTLVQVRLDGASVGEDNLAIHRGRMDPEGHLHRGWHYPAEQVREEATQVAFRSAGPEAGLVSVLIPAGSEDEVGVEVEQHDDGTLTLVVRGAEGTARVGIDADGTPTRLP
ncbi:alginate lyase family protein [Micrococcus luteus]|uniref:alginate lyase family protein n=1 Tax=Micrococcus luteus TaxID=1270 RepID=UPI00366AC51E